MGLTGIHDFDGARCLQGLQLLREGGRLGLRVLKNIPYADLNAAIQVGLRSGFGDEWIRLGHAKVFADGALGPRTAAMLEAYDDAPGNLGIGFLDAEELLERALRAGEHGWGMAIHAIGDRANHIVLDALAALREQEQLRGWVRRRHRIEHLQLLHPADIPRPAALGVVASMQPFHATSDMEMADRGWGARVRSAYAWRSQLSAGAILAFGSDAPVESPNPFWGLHAAITRRRSDGSPGLAGWVPQEKLGLSEALAGYTRGAALAAGWEESAGFLGPGSWADLIVLDDDPFRIEPDAVRDLSPVGVMTDGEFRLRKF
jgi:predicted amidohydrolase YtcJ